MVQTLKKNKVDATLYSRPWKNIRPTWQIRYKGADWLDNYLLSKSTQYKKLLPNALRLTYWNLKPCKSHEKNQTKNIRPLVFHFSPIDSAFSFLFHVVCKISNFDKWTAKHLPQASFTELTLLQTEVQISSSVPNKWLAAGLTYKDCASLQKGKKSWVLATFWQNCQPIQHQ